MKLHFLFRKLTVAGIFLVSFIACNDDKTDSNEEKKTAKVESKQTETTKIKTTNPAQVSDGPAIGQIETNDFVLKVHRAITFELAPKSYEPIKVPPGHKLVVLDISIRNKTAGQYNMGKILIMTEVKDSKGKNDAGPWVVGAYMVDHPDAGHQPEYDALWSDHFGAGEFHRAILLGLDPPKEEKTITLLVPEKANYNAPRKELKIAIE
jgi:hypothetical protein